MKPASLPRGLGRLPVQKKPRNSGPLVSGLDALATSTDATSGNAPRAALAGHRPLATEADETRTLAEWLTWRRIVFAHPPNEGKRKPSTGAGLKRMGMQAGLPDFLVFTPPRNPLAALEGMREKAYGVRGVAIELKRADGGAGPSPAQREWLSKLDAVGWATRVCNGATEAIGWLESLGY